MFAAWLVSLALLAYASAESYTLHHRFLPDGKFVPRGVVNVDDGVATFTADPSALDTQGQGDWYQVGLEVLGGDYITTSTRSCFVDKDAKLTIHVSPSGRPTSIEFKPAAVPSDGTCSNVGVRSLPNSGVQVAVERPVKVYSPGLSAPPQVDTTTGQVKEPEPEKTFMQKYGLMLAGFAFVLMLNAGKEPEPQRVEGGGGSGGQ